MELERHELQSYAVLLDSQGPTVKVFHLARSVDPEHKPEVTVTPEGDPITTKSPIDIFNSEKPAQIQGAIDPLLKSAHERIQELIQERQPVSGLLGHDAIPLFFVHTQQQPYPLKDQLERIATAVHTSGCLERDGWQFRIDRPDRYDPDSAGEVAQEIEDLDYSYRDEDTAKKAMRKAFRPVIVATGVLQAPESDSTETPLTIWRHAWIENRCFDLPTQTAIVKDTSSPSDPIGIRIKHLMDHYSCDRFHLYFPQPLDSTFDPPPSAESTESQYAHLESIKAVKEPQLPPDHVVVTYVSKAPSALPQSGHEVRSYQPAQKPRWSQKQLRAAEKCIERGVKYIVVIDAGSSGSRAYVYTWEQHGIREGELPKLKLLPGGPIEVEPGIARCTLPDGQGLNPDHVEAAKQMRRRVEDYLQPLLNEACERIGSHMLPTLLAHEQPRVQSHILLKHTRVGLFVGATGGMRALLEQNGDPGRATAIADAATLVANSYRRGLFDHRLYRTISGSTEGVLGWVAANYSNDISGGSNVNATFATQNNANGCGYLEMGGQTMQAAFTILPPHDAEAHDNGTQAPEVPQGLACPYATIFINRRYYRVFAQCWGNGGANATWDSHRVRQQAVDVDAGNCLPAGVLAQEGRYAGTGRIWECIDECESLADSLRHNEGNNRGLVLLLPSVARVRAGQLAEWVGSANFFYAVRGVFADDQMPISELPNYNHRYSVPLLAAIKAAALLNLAGYQARNVVVGPIKDAIRLAANGAVAAAGDLAADIANGTAAAAIAAAATAAANAAFTDVAARLWIRQLGGNLVEEVERKTQKALERHQAVNPGVDAAVNAAFALIDRYSRNDKFLWRSVFNLIYTTQILSRGFGWKIRVQGNRNNEIDNICGDNQILPPEPERRDREAILKAFLYRATSDNPEGGTTKEYRVVDPGKKPWAEGAALIYACNVRNRNAFTAVVSR